MAGILAEGTLYVEETIAGIAQGLVVWPGLAKLEVKMSSEIKESISKDKGTYGQVLASVVIPKPNELSIEITDISKNALAAALQGSGSALAQGSGTVTAQAITAKLGKFIELGKLNIGSSGFILTNAAASVTYVLGTDYTVNYALGYVGILSTGAITDAQALKATYTYAAVAGDKVLGATVPQIIGKLVLDGRNLVDGKPMQIIVWQANLSADGAVDFMGSDLIKLAMKGRMTTPSGKASAYEVNYNLAYS